VKSRQTAASSGHVKPKDGRIGLEQAEAKLKRQMRVARWVTTDFLAHEHYQAVGHISSRSLFRHGGLGENGRIGSRGRRSFAKERGGAQFRKNRAAGSDLSKYRRRSISIIRHL